MSALLHGFPVCGCFSVEQEKGSQPCVCFGQPGRRKYWCLVCGLRGQHAPMSSLTHTLVAGPSSFQNKDIVIDCIRCWMLSTIWGTPAFSPSYLSLPEVSQRKCLSSTPSWGKNGFSFQQVTRWWLAVSMLFFILACCYRVWCWQITTL